MENKSTDSECDPCPVSALRVLLAQAGIDTHLPYVLLSALVQKQKIGRLDATNNLQSLKRLLVTLLKDILIPD